MIKRLYAKIGNVISWIANKKEFEDQSAIKGNLSQNNAFLMAKHGLMELDQIRLILVSHLGIFGEQA